MFRKLFSLLTIILMTTSPAAAQDNEVAAAAALDSVIRIFPHYDIVDNFVDEVFKKHKKSASMATRIAKSYYSFVENPETKQRTYYRRDLPRAFSYIDKALAINPKYSKAYIVASDIFFNEAKLDTAQMWLDKGIAVNPTDSALYIESAKLLAFTDPDAAVKKLMVLKQRDSTFQVDLQLGRLYFELWDKHGKTPMMELATSYGKVFDSADRDKMNLGDFGAYGYALRWATDMGDERFERLYEGMNYALKRFPGDYGLNHFLLYGCTQSRRWDEGIAAANTIFAMPDSKRVYKVEDCLFYATCLAGKKNYAEAIAEYERIQTIDGATDNQKLTAENMIDQTLNSQIKELKDMGEYEKAIAVIEPYVLRSRESGKQNDALVSSYAKIYMDWSEELNGQEKMDVIAKGVKLYAESVPYASEANVPIFLYYSLAYSAAYLDPKFEEDLGLPYAEQLIKLLGAKDDVSSSQKSFLVQAYRYMMMYEIYKEKKNYKKTAMAYADKILDLDPTNADALRVISILSGKK